MSDVLRILIVGAHPDDCEVHFAGLAALYAERGHKVMMMSMTDGRCGHFSMKPAELVKRRRTEARNAAKAVGAVSKVMPFHDTRLVADLPTRFKFLREVRKFAPDLMLIHKLNDYHPDHRASVQLVYDISYLLTVPSVEPSVKAMGLKRTPVICHSARGNWEGDRVICVPIDDVWDKKFEAMHEHTSQFYEWLVWEQGKLSEVPKSRKGRLRYLKNWRGPQYKNLADRCKKLVKRLPKKQNFTYAEAVYPAWAGAGLTPDKIEKLFPFPKLLIGFSSERKTIRNRS